MLKLSLLFYEYFKIGLFTFGGGYASLPFLYRISEIYNWFSNSELTQMIAISALTPGPVGFNMATFCGFKTFGIFGSIVASIALILPMLIITTQVFRLYRAYCENEYVKSVLYILRPTSCALILSVAVKLIHNYVFNNYFSFSSIDLKATLLLIVLYLSTFKLNRNPINYMLIASLFSLVIYFVKL